MHQFQNEGKAEFLHNLPLFHYIPKDQLLTLAEKVAFKRYTTNTLLLRQEDQPTSIYFIKAGIVKVLRKVDFKIPTTQAEANNANFLIQDPTLEEYD